MFTTKNMVHDVKDVPQSWIFEHFCKLPDKLNGHDVKIKSLFNNTERTPSMCIYLDKNKLYKYKCFSTGKAGSAIDLLKELNNMNYYQSCNLIVENYNDFVLHNNGGYDVQSFRQQSKYKVTKCNFRPWNTQDSYFWTQFNIGSKLLEEHCVRPMENYTMFKQEEAGEKRLTINGNYLYGFFKQDGSLYKIYQPKTKDKKFIKVADYIQGSEQLKKAQYLVITSSLKDVMALKSLKLQMDCIAPDSENSMIRKPFMENYLDNYQKVILLFDYDDAGISAMRKYKELYPSVETCLLPMSKDPSDSIKDFGAAAVRDRLVPLIDKKLV